MTVMLDTRCTLRRQPKMARGAKSKQHPYARPTPADGHKNLDHLSQINWRKTVANQVSLDNAVDRGCVPVWSGAGRATGQARRSRRGWWLR